MVSGKAAAGGRGKSDLEEEEEEEEVDGVLEEEMGYVLPPQQDLGFHSRFAEHAPHGSGEWLWEGGGGSQGGGMRVEEAQF